MTLPSSRVHPRSESALAVVGTSKIFRWLAIAVFTLFTVRIPLLPEEGLDPSWQVGLSFAWLHGLKLGRDFVFTYGPAGFLENRIQVAEVLPLQILWLICTRAAVAIIFVGSLNFTTLKKAAAIVSAVLLILIPASEARAIVDAYYSFAIVLGTAFMVRAGQEKLSLLAAFLFASFALVKFSATVEILWAFCLVAVCSFFGGRFPQRRINSWRGLRLCLRPLAAFETGRRDAETVFRILVANRRRVCRRDGQRIEMGGACSRLSSRSPVFSRPLRGAYSEVRKISKRSRSLWSRLVAPT